MLVSNLILSGHARDDGPDVRSVVISGYLILCLTAPLAFGAARPVGLGSGSPGNDKVGGRAAQMSGVCSVGATHNQALAGCQLQIGQI